MSVTPARKSLRPDVPIQRNAPHRPKHSPWLQAIAWVLHGGAVIVLVQWGWDAIKAYLDAVWNAFYLALQRYGWVWFRQPCAIHDTFLLPGSCDTSPWVYLLGLLLAIVGGYVAGLLYIRALNATWDAFWAKMRTIVVDAVAHALRDAAQTDRNILIVQHLIIVVVVSASVSCEGIESPSDLRVTRLPLLIVVHISQSWMRELQCQGCLTSLEQKTISDIVEGEVVKRLIDVEEQSNRSPVAIRKRPSQ